MNPKTTIKSAADGGRVGRLGAGLNALTLSIALAAGLPPPAAHAQQGPATQISIPAQSLHQSLLQLGQQTDIQIYYLPETVAGRRAPGVSGLLTPEQALRALLQGTGVQANWNGRTVSLSRPPSGNASQQLAPVVVRGVLDPVTEGTGDLATRGPATSATGLRLTLRETPQSISIMTAQRIEDQALDDVSSVLKQVTGVSVDNTMTDLQTYYSRGFAIENFQFDGMPALFEGGWNGGVSKMDSAIYDRIEVIRGATGLLNGSGYPSATINLVRKKPTLEPQAEIQLQAGSWDLRRVQADLSGPLAYDGRLRGRIVAAHQTRNSFMDYRSTEKVVGYGVVEMDVTPDTLLTLGADWQKNDNNGASYGGTPLFYSDGTPTTDVRRSFNPASRWAYWDQTSYNIFGRLEHRFANDWEAKLALSRQSLHDDAFATATASGNPDRITGEGLLQWICRCNSRRTTDTAEFQISGPFTALGRSHDLVLGASFMDSRRQTPRYNVLGYDNSVDNFYEWDGDTIKPDYFQNGNSDATIRQRGFYAATRLRPTDALSVIVGSRLSTWKEEWTDDFGSGPTGGSLSQRNIFTPYAGIVYDITPQHSVYASYTEIFRPQSGVRDRDYNPLDPVTGTNIELGAKSELLGGALLASAAIFQIQQDNVAVLDEDYTLPLPDGSAAYRPAKGVKSKGFELELTGRLTPSWQIQLGYTQQSSRDASGEKINTNLPDRSLKLWTTYRLAGRLQGLTLGAGVNWQNRTTYTAGGWGVPPAIVGKTAVQPSYALVSLMAHYQVSKQLSFMLNVDNLLDKTYYKGFGTYGSGVYGDPRNFSLAARYRF